MDRRAIANSHGRAASSAGASAIAARRRRRPRLPRPGPQQGHPHSATRRRRRGGTRLGRGGGTVSRARPRRKRLALFPQSSLKRPSERPERARRVKNAAKRRVQVEGLEPETPLTMRSDRQLVATGGNGFVLISRIRRQRDLRPVATGCDHGAPQRLHFQSPFLAKETAHYPGSGRLQDRRGRGRRSEPPVQRAGAWCLARPRTGGSDAR
jgi:hypothetical protein